jgi:hypothetical protein
MYNWRKKVKRHELKEIIKEEVLKEYYKFTDKMANDIAFAFAEYLAGNQKNGLNILKKYAGKFSFTDDFDLPDTMVFQEQLHNDFFKTIRKNMKQ